ncbi:MAG: type I pantothenate kinase [Pseudomonadota bacterium]
MSAEDFPLTVGIEAVADRVRTLQSGRDTLVIAITGSVASGKSTFARHLEQVLEPGLDVETVSTDGFLFTTAYLRENGLFERKGFPESYDRAAMQEAIESVREGPTDFPGYSHITFDPDPALTRTIDTPDILLLEGVGFLAPQNPPRAHSVPDLLFYIDADLAHIEAWYVERFLRFWHAAKDDPTSFYAQFLHMSEEELIQFAKTVWAGINLPNLEQNILPLREHADLVVKKDDRHAVTISIDRTA